MRSSKVVPAGISLSSVFEVETELAAVNVPVLVDLTDERSVVGVELFAAALILTAAEIAVEVDATDEATEEEVAEEDEDEEFPEDELPSQVKTAGPGIV